MLEVAALIKKRKESRFLFSAPGKPVPVARTSKSTAFKWAIKTFVVPMDLVERMEANGKEHHVDQENEEMG